MATELIVGGLKSSGSSSGRNITTEDVSLATMDIQVPILNSIIRLGKDMERVASEKVYVRDVLTRWFLWRENYGDGVVEVLEN